MNTEHFPFKNKPLPYAYDALEPYIDSETMQVHHNGHLQKYIDNLNATLENYPMLHNKSLEWLILNSQRLPFSIRTAVEQNAGGVYNHFFYFEELIPKGSSPEGKILELINSQFGSFEIFKNKLEEEGLKVFGSGYAWLVFTNRGRLEIMHTANQETPLPKRVLPLLNLDVWEHAYYLKHKNKRADYINDFYHVINWIVINERLKY